MAVVPAARSNGRLVGWSGFATLFATSTYITNALVEPDPNREPLYHYDFFFAGLLQFAFLFGIGLLIAIRAPKRDLFALRAPPSWNGAFGLIGALLLLNIAATVAYALIVNPPDEQGLTPEHWPPSSVGAFALSLVILVLVAPSVEELLYRGVGFALLERFGTKIAIGGTALAFGLGHGFLFALVPLTIFGATVAVVRSRTGSIYPCIAMHATWNALAVVLGIVIER